VRNIPANLAHALEQARRRRGTSLNQTVIDLLNQCLAVGTETPPRNGLGRLAGTWSAEEHARFERAVAATEQIDEELWR
jgi:hypothetical protein